MKAPMLNALSQEQRSMIETGRLIVEGDDKLSAKSVHVDWDNGSVMFDPDHLEKSVSQILSRSFEKLSQCADATDVCKEVDDG